MDLLIKHNIVKLALPLCVVCPQILKGWRGLNSFEGPPKSRLSSMQQSRVEKNVC